MNIKTKHDFILYNKYEGKWYDKTLSPITLDKGLKDLSLLNSPNLKSINSGMGYKLYPNEESYNEAKAKTYKEKQENRKIINNRDHFHAALLESTSEVFKLLTQKQDDSLKEEKEIVKQLKDLTAIKEKEEQKLNARTEGRKEKSIKEKQENKVEEEEKEQDEEEKQTEV